MTAARFPSLLLIAALAAASGCSEELPPPTPSGPTIEPRIFERALSDLVVARVELLPDTAAYDSRASEILAGHGIEREDLVTFVRARGQDDDLMSGVYARLSARLDSLYPARSPAEAIPPADAVSQDSLP